MRFIHLSDLHIGKRVNDFPMYEDQEYVLKQVIDVIKNNNIDGVIIAGDISVSYTHLTQPTIA